MTIFIIIIYTFVGKIFKQGTKIQWPYTDMMKYMSQGDVFNATCRCIGHQSASIWRVFDKDGSQINVSPDASTLCNIGTESCTDIYLTIKVWFHAHLLTPTFHHHIPPPVKEH